MKGVDQSFVEAFDAAVQAALNDEEFKKEAAESNFMVNYANHTDFAAQVQSAAELAVPILESIQ